MRYIGITILAWFLVLTVSSTAQAKRYRTNVSGKQVVMHTRVAPVVAHRIVPPFHGTHVYEVPRRSERRIRRSR